MSFVALEVAVKSEVTQLTLVRGFPKKPTFKMAGVKFERCWLLPYMEGGSF